METKDHEDLIRAAFSQDVELARRVHDAMRDQPSKASLYVDISRYVIEAESKEAVIGGRKPEGPMPLGKKRKLENGTASVGELPQDCNIKVMFEARELSFSMPIRKKLNLEVARALESVTGSLPPDYQVRARNPTSGQLEYNAGMQSFKYALKLPVPEKARRQFNFVLLPEHALGIGDRPITDNLDLQEPLVWTVTDGPQKVIIFSDEKLEEATQMEDGALIDRTLDSCLEKSPAGRLIQASEVEFVSAAPEAHRKGDKAYHVKAVRGSKDGYLFFLATGIFFGYKKPLAFFPFEFINSISYTSVLQRTFNLNIAVQVPDQDEIKEHEFSMIDQMDFPGIDSYVKRHSLQDASLAESRRAKKLNLNGTKKGDENGQVGDGELQSELEKARQDIEDAEDEEEVDFDPGEEELSDGSGGSSEQDEYENTDVEGDEGDLVAQELGSEAEDVAPNPDDEDHL